MDTLRQKPSLEDAIVSLAHGFTGLFSRIEEEQQLTPEDFALFKKSYTAAYPDLYRAIVASYHDAGVAWHPIDAICNASDRYREREKQALLVVGVKMLELSLDERRVQSIVTHLAYKNDINISEMEVIQNILRMQSFIGNTAPKSSSIS